MGYGFTKGKYSRYRSRNVTRRTGGKITGYRRRNRGSSRRTRSRSRKTWASTFRRWGGYVQSASKALSLAKHVYALINPEFKFVDNNTLASQYTSTTPVVNFITSIGQGSDESNRTGNSVLLKYIKCTFNFKYNNSTNPCTIRVTIVSTETGDAPDPADIYEATGSGTAITLSNWRKNSPIRYKVWFDRIFHIDQYNPQRVYRHVIKARGHHHIKYTGAAPTSTGPGNFWSISTTDNAASGIGPLRSELYRITYIDN